MNRDDQKSVGPLEPDTSCRTLSKIVVVGSVNMDLVVRTETIPTPGQTVRGRNFATLPGGKGANQAIAAAHCGAQVSMIARVGNDDFGERLLLGLNSHHVNTESVMVSEAISTGTAMIIVDKIGDLGEMPEEVKRDLETLKEEGEKTSPCPVKFLFNKTA